MATPPDAAAAAADPWSLFDGRADEIPGPARLTMGVRVELPEDADLTGLGVWAAGDGLITALADGPEGPRPIPGLQGVRVRAVEVDNRWQLLAARAPLRTRSFSIEWDARSLSVRELAIWAAGGAPRAVADAELPDRLQTETPAGAATLPTNPSSVRVETFAFGAPAPARVRFSLPRDPRAFERAFLVYELEGLAHWTYVRRRINGQAAPAVRSDGRAGGGGLQVEEIPTGALRAGDNEIVFLPAAARNGSAAYMARDLRVVAVAAPDPAALQRGTARALIDGDDATGLVPARAGDAGGGAAEIAFAAVLEPQFLSFRLQGDVRGVLTVAAADAEQRARRGRVDVALGPLRAGWHTLAVAGSLPTADRFRVVVRGEGGEGAPRGQVTELAIAGTAPPAPADAAPPLRVTFPLHGECSDGGAFVRGYVGGSGGARLELRAAGVTAPVSVGADGMFGGALPLPAPAPVDLLLTAPGGRTFDRRVELGPCAPPAPAQGPPVVEDRGAPYGVWVRAGAPATLAFGGATLEIPAGAVARDVRVTVRPLAQGQVPRMDPLMTDVVPDGRGFRLGPHGLTFKKPVRLTLPIAPERVPGGVKAAHEVFTFFFDEARGRWTRLERAATATAEMPWVTSLTMHFTDFVNATLAIPDHPGADRFDPTSIKDLKVGDPAAGIALIAPPEGGSTGTARTSLALVLPPGRNGLTPSLAFAYDSGGANSWLGVGWDLRASSIEIDTRFGVPRYDGSERYLLDGEALRPLGRNGPNGGPLFARRAEGEFERIERIGAGPAQFRWEITDKSGTRRVYGATAASRLASYVAPGPIFRWHVETITDTFNNRADFNYVLDQGNNGEPFRQLYLSHIGYVAHPQLTAAYHVDFVNQTSEDACTRPDQIIDGRAGFQLLTRCRLDRVNVRFGEETVRQYVMHYTPGNYGKSLLDSIDVRGLSGTNSFYKHTFEYFTTPETATTLNLFAPPVAWGAVTRLSASHDDTHETATIGNGRVVVGIPELGIGLGASRSTGDGASAWRLMDVSSDSLTDGIASNGLLNFGQLLGTNRTTPAGLTGAFQAGQSAANVGPISHSNRDYIGGEAGLFGRLFSATVNRSFKNRARETRTLIDMNGDGFPDEFGYAVGLVPGGGFSARIAGLGPGVRLNDGRGNFGPAAPWPNLSLNHLGCEGPALIDRALDALGNVVRWIAGAAGEIDITGAVGKALATPGRAIASVFKNDTLLWSHTMGDGDMTVCEPAPGNGCGGGLTIAVQPGDRIYMLTSPFEGSLGDVINWDPQVTYRTVDGQTLTPEQRSLREPDGGFIYRATQSQDFRLVGRLQLPWSADARGTVRVDSVLDKLPTSDQVELQIVRRESDGSSPTVVFRKKVSAASSGRLSVVPPEISVDAGDFLTFEVISDLPIDPARADWKPSVEYKSYCVGGTGANRHHSGGSARPPLTCGHVDCPDPPPPAPGTEDDPAANLPVPLCRVVAGGRTIFTVPREIIQRRVMPFYPLFMTAPGAITQTFVVGQGGAADVDGVFTKTMRTPRPVVVAVQGVNRLFLKRVLQPHEVGSFATRVRAEGLAPGDQLFFTVFSDTDVRGAVAWTPRVNGRAAPVSVKWQTPGAPRDPSGHGVLDVMTSGYRGWAFGQWNARKPFDERGITFDPADETPDFVPMFAEPPATPDGVEAQIAALIPNPISVFKDIVSAGGDALGGIGNEIIDAGQDLVRGGAHVFNNAIGLGQQLLGGFAGLIFDIFFCRRIHGIRVSDTNMLGVAASAGVSGSFASGDSSTRADLLDMNGDRLPDLVTGGGIRFSTGTGFQPTLSLGLPLGDPRHARQRNLQGGVGFGGNDLLTKTDGEGESEGFVGSSIGAGLNYGLSVTDRDLVDVNGDGLPDHVASDASGRLLVRLNFGFRFGAAMIWSASP